MCYPNQCVRGFGRHSYFIISVQSKWSSFLWNALVILLTGKGFSDLSVMKWYAMTIFNKLKSIGFHISETIWRNWKWWHKGVFAKPPLWFQLDQRNLLLLLFWEMWLWNMDMGILIDGINIVVKCLCIVETCSPGSRKHCHGYEIQNELWWKVQQISYNKKTWNRSIMYARTFRWQLFLNHFFLNGWVYVTISEYSARV